MGINKPARDLHEKYYDNLEGGILESFGRLFPQLGQAYIYPMTKARTRCTSRRGRGARLA